MRRIILGLILLLSSSMSFAQKAKKELKPDYSKLNFVINDAGFCTKVKGVLYSPDALLRTFPECVTKPLADSNILFSCQQSSLKKDFVFSSSEVDCKRYIARTRLERSPQGPVYLLTRNEQGERGCIYVTMAFGDPMGRQLFMQSVPQCKREELGLHLTKLDCRNTLLNNEMILTSSLEACRAYRGPESEE